MAMKICFEEEYVLETLGKCKENDLAIADIDSIDPKDVRATVARGVHVYAYLNACALERGRSYYDDFEHLRIAEYNGWPDEYWVDITGKGWKEHLLSEAKRFKEAGAKGLYFDNTDLYYNCLSGFREEHTDLMKPSPRAWSVYETLMHTMKELVAMGLVVMPNGGDTFVRKLVANGHRNLLKTVIQESVLYSGDRRVSSAETEYFTEYLDWCKEQGLYVRGIEYCKRLDRVANAKAYYRRHGWNDVYISKHHDLRGD